MFGIYGGVDRIDTAVCTMTAVINMRYRIREKLRIEAIGNVGWDPVIAHILHARDRAVPTVALSIRMLENCCVVGIGSL